MSVKDARSAFPIMPNYCQSYYEIERYRRARKAVATFKSSYTRQSLRGDFFWEGLRLHSIVP
jgi:hypothetical protein